MTLLRPSTIDRFRDAAPAKRTGLAASVGPLFAVDRRRRRPFRIRANAGERRQHRLLSRAAEAGDAASRDRVRRSVRAHSGARAARVADRTTRRASFLAVDGQPDGTVARKRFWRGNFLFAQDPALGSPGFKRFRPIVRDKNGALRRLTNDEIAKNPQYGDFSLDQSQARDRRLLRSNG